MWLLRKILFPVSLLYGLIVYLRNRFYDWGIFSSKTYDTPIIVVGNLNVGGTGKTPMVEFLITLLQDKYRLAVLSRGYRRKSKGFVLATNDSTADDLGDEPFQIHSKFANVQVAVDANRQNGIALLERDTKPDLIILDDAFQHRRVTPGFSILLTAFSSLYSSDWYLPTGNLRDNKREAKRANTIIVTKNPPNSSESERASIKNQLKPEAHQEVLFSYLKYGLNLGGKGSLRAISDLKNTKITLVTGIANSKPLLDFLKKEEISFDHLSFRDHHNFSSSELEMLKSKPNILTTEKDYMRLKGDVVCNFLTVQHVLFTEDLHELKMQLEAFMSRYA